MTAESVLAECTPKQVEAIGMLHGYVENLDCEVDQPHSAFTKLVAFTGDGQDGPCMGFINPDGTIDWMVEA